MQVVNQALEKVRRYLEMGQVEEAIRVLEALRPADQAEVFEELNPEQQKGLLPRLDVSDSADILEYIEDERAAELANAMEPARLSRILDEMEPDEAADLLGDLPPSKAAELIKGMADAEEIIPLLAHPDDTAGGRMTTEFIALNRDMTVGEAIAYIREHRPRSQDIYYLYVVDDDGRLCGVVGFRELIAADPSTTLSEVMDPDVIFVKADMDQEECALLMSHYDLMALPVVDGERHLLGVITVDDIMDIIEEEATEDIQRMSGMEPLDTPYMEATLFSLIKKRFGWLMLLFVAEAFTGTVMRHFHSELEKAVALAFFVPLLIGTGGNAGSQATSMIIRGLAIGEIDWGDFLRVVLREVTAGLVLGAMVAGAGFLRALTWGSSPALALTVALSIVILITWANTIGALLPMAAHRLGIDPAVMSAPLLSTLVDATGLFIYFSIAKLVMRL